MGMTVFSLTFLDYNIVIIGLTTFMLNLCSFQERYAV